MNEDSVFSHSNVLLSNINSINRQQHTLSERKACELAFLADEIADIAVSLSPSMSLYEIILQLSSELPETDRAAYESELVPLSPSRCVLAVGGSADGAMLCSLIVEKLRDRGIPITEREFLNSEAAPETFTYVKNSLADEAYDVLSQDFSDPRVAYSESFGAAAAAVADGKVGYCILPFEEVGGTRIPGIVELINSLDLKIVAITPVFGFEGNADMKYALVGRGFDIPDRDEDTDRYLEIELSGASVSLPLLLASAESLGASVYRINTLYKKSDPTEAFYSIVFRDGGESFSALLLYLALFAEDYSPLGIYKNLE
ncbi:MAG: hypothetical protein IKD45_05195 [Clostridia bacterium]|nr:hypothetical protein [Clostridia bacterium]